MEVILLSIYAAIVWVLVKFKILPWNTGTQVTVVIIPVVALTALILYLNVVAPSSADVRVIKYVVNVVPQVRGRVLEVPGRPEPAGPEGRCAVPSRSHPLRADGARARGTARQYAGILARAR